MKKSLLLLIALFGTLPASIAAVAVSPNIVVYLSDDHSQFDSSLYGNTNIPTPNFQKLAADGITFTNHSDLHRKPGAGAYWTEWAALTKTDSRARAILNRYYQRPEFELYRMDVGDKWEQHNLAADPAHAETLAGLKNELAAWMTQQTDTGRLFGKPRPLAEPDTWHPDHIKPLPVQGKRKRQPARQTSLASPAKASRKNVLFILADDLGWSDTTLYGQTSFYRTPNIERLAKRGVTFTRAYSASPLCSPTRAAILTGLSPARIGLTAPNCHLPKTILKADIGKTARPNQKAIAPESVTRLKTGYPTIAKTLKKAGYSTGHFGKWHLGPEPYSPLQHGFDVDLPHWPGPGPAGSYVAPWKFKNFDADPGEPNQHIEDRMAREAVAFLEKHRNEPFFLNYWMFSVHAPFDAKKELVEKYRVSANPNDPQRSPTYAAMIESMDDAVGTLLDALDRLGLADNTIVVFTSDNGGNMYNEIDGTTPTSNAPLRGGKATMFDGGTRVPCIVSVPGVTRAGARSDAIVQSEDFYPTLLDALSLKPSPDQHFDGVSMLPVLKGDKLARDAVFQYFPHNPPVPDWLPPSVSVHRGDWKLIRLFHGGDKGTHRHLLFNLHEDIGEKRNLATSQPKRVAELDKRIESFLVETSAVLPVENPAFDPATYRPEDEGKAKPKNKRKPKPKAASKAASSSGAAPVKADSSTSDRKPNIIVIYTDDHGYADLSCQDVLKDIRTPNVDALAAAGARMTDGYSTAPQCVPSRAGLLTGRFQARFGLESNGGSLEGFNRQTTIARRLQSAGYATAQFGKWHLGATSEIPEHGFTHVFAQNANAPFFANITLDGADRPMGRLDNQLYHIDGCSRAATSIINRYKDQPFFLYVAYRAPHVPLDAPKKYLSRFPGEMPERRRQALAMISAMDDGVGLITDTLKELKLTERTLIFYIGDNGAPLKIHKFDAPGGGPGWDGSLNDPLNGEKGMLAEGGIRVPFVVSWPGRIPAGQVFKHPVTALDVAATAVGIAGIETPKGELDGVNLIPFLSTKETGAPHTDLRWRWAAQSALREGDWKILRGGDREYLYNLATDKEEKHNLAQQHPEIVERLRKRLSEWCSKLEPPGLANGRMASVWTQYYDYYLEGKPAPPPRTNVPGKRRRRTLPAR